MHIVRAQAVELDWTWQRGERWRGEGRRGRVAAPNQQSRRRDAILCGKGAGKLEDGAAEMLHFTFIASDCWLCVSVCVCCTGLWQQ